jgi:hypothetical protein
MCVRPQLSLWLGSRERLYGPHWESAAPAQVLSMHMQSMHVQSMHVQSMR